MGGWKYFVRDFSGIGSDGSDSIAGKAAAVATAGRLPHAKNAPGKSSGIKLACGEQAAAPRAEPPARAS